MNPDELLAAPTCRACGRGFHPGMRVERVFAALFNSVFAVLAFRS